MISHIKSVLQKVPFQSRFFSFFEVAFRPPALYKMY